MTWSGVMPPSRKAMLKAVTTGDSSRHAITQIEDSVSESKGGLRQKPNIPSSASRPRAAPAPLGLGHQPVRVLLEQEALPEQLTRGPLDRRDIGLLVGVALLQRGPRIARRGPFRPGAGEGD